MKKMTTFLRGFIAAMLLLALSTVSAGAADANKKTSVAQVTTAVVVSDNVDYVITSAQPFGENGLVNITNTDHAVLILGAVKPSQAGQWMKYVKINGADAVNGNNCEVKLYNRGCIILPYDKNLKPLTVYSEQNFGGESCNDFGFENTGGFMNTLNNKKLNNRIRSFKLKRGHMVTFSLKARGRGYSRCFIAADQDLEMATLPGIMDNSITSYRVFKWYDTGKACLANDTRATSVSLLNVTSCYSFGLGESRLPDAECVPHHIYEDWPSAAACGQVNYSPHMKTNNEPGNSADDRPQSVETILNNWENLMATGMRLCSPSSHDGSLAHLREFLDSVDARGWRCDILDLHCYWPESSFNTWSFESQWAGKYGRPIWISEWVWGASWNKNGAFADGVTEAQNTEALKRICTNLNNWDCIERYYYWNSERDPSKILRNDGSTLTGAGNYYATINSGLGYKGNYNYVPKIPKQYGPGHFIVKFDNKTNVAKLTWHDYNGEMNASMTVERRLSGKDWTKLATIALEEDGADYEYNDSSAVSGCQYRIVVVDANNVTRNSAVVMAALEGLHVGDAVDVSGKTKYLGGNVLVNGNFDMGTYGWTNGMGAQLASPYFETVAIGGCDGGSYLQCYGHGAYTLDRSVNTTIELKTAKSYYLSGYASRTNSVNNSVVYLYNSTGTMIGNFSFLNTTDNWISQYKVFTGDDIVKANFRFYNLQAKAQYDNLVLAQLFDTKEEAIADGVAKARLRADAFKAYNTLYAFLNNDLDNSLAAVTTSDLEAEAAVTEAVNHAIAAYDILRQNTEYVTYVKKLVGMKLVGYEAAQTALADYEAATTVQAVETTFAALQTAVEEYMPFTSVAGKITQPKFVSATGWTTKCGTYTAGDQRQNSQDGITFWNAWWSGINASDLTMTMAIKQDVKSLDPGLYAIECKASTQHFCQTDQHGYITNGTDREETNKLTLGYFDLSNVNRDDRWQTLTSAPVYVGDGGGVTIGFEGSKKGAVDNAWREVGNTTSTGDKREGWWCATDFVLRYYPMMKKTVVPNQFGVICLPYAARPSQGMKFYQIVGINPSYTQLCLQEMEESEAGVPFIYRSEVADVVFYEFGNVATRVSDGSGNIRGFLKTTNRVPQNYYFLTDGVWTKITESADRPQMTNYTGIIRPFTDTGSKPVPVYDEWTGDTMPISGVTEEEKTANSSGIELPKATIVLRPDGIYSLDGRMMPVDSRLKRGIYVKVVGGRAYKTVVR